MKILSVHFDHNNVTRKKANFDLIMKPLQKC